jgi:hypothetical protein
MSKCAVVWRIIRADSNQANSLAGRLRACPSRSNLPCPDISSPGDGGLLVSGGHEHMAFRVCGRDHRGVSLQGGGHDPGGAGRSGLPSLSHSASCGPESALSSTTATRSPPTGGRRGVETGSGSWRACPLTSAGATGRHLYPTVRGTTDCLAASCVAELPASTPCSSLRRSTHTHFPGEYPPHTPPGFSTLDKQGVNPATREPFI